MMRGFPKRLRHSTGGAILEYLPLSSFILLAALAAIQFIGDSQADALCNAAGMGEEMQFSRSQDCCIPVSVIVWGGGGEVEAFAQKICDLKKGDPYLENQTQRSG